MHAVIVVEISIIYYNISMIIRKAYKFRLKTNPEIEEKFSQFSGCCRLVWNKAWAMNKFRLEEKQKLLWYQDMAWFLTFWKKTEELSFLKQAPSQALQHTLRSLERAIKDGFDKNQPLKRMPRFKKKGRNDSFRYPQGFKTENKRIFLPKLGWVGFFKSRELIGTVKNVTISRRGKHWFCSIQTELEVPEPIHTSTTVIGLDMGVKRFFTMSDGNFIEPLNSFRKLETKLAKFQRSLARKVKFSNNWKKQKQRIAEIHTQIASARNDFLQKFSTIISKKHAIVVMEDLQIRNMSASVSGSVDNPGHNVKAKAGLNKSILDQGWYEFRRQLEYKLNWLGGKLLLVPAQYSSQACPVCRHVSKENRQTQAVFVCMNCGHAGHADHVAAINILERGYRLLACGEERAPSSMKQEPASSCEAYSPQVA